MVIHLVREPAGVAYECFRLSTLGLDSRATPGTSVLHARKSGPTPDNSVLLLLGDQQQPRGSLPEGSATYNRRQPPGVGQVAVASGACGDGKWKEGTEERICG